MGFPLGSFILLVTGVANKPFPHLIGEFDRKYDVARWKVNAERLYTVLYLAYILCAVFVFDESKAFIVPGVFVAYITGAFQLYNVVFARAYFQGISPARIACIKGANKGMNGVENAAESVI